MKAIFSQNGGIKAVLSSGPIPAAAYTVTRLDDTTTTNEGAIDVENYLGSPNWEQMVAAFGRGYNYPQSSQTTSYRTGDEAYIETNVFNSARNANTLKIFNSLSNWTTLNNNNSFGNTNRFTDSVGGQNYDGTGGSLVGYVVDNFTGLGFYVTQDAVTDWNDAIDTCLGSDFGGSGTYSSYLGFTNWFLGSINQLFSIWKQGSGSNEGFDYSPINIAGTLGTGRIACSTTDASPTTSTGYFRNSNAFILVSQIKTYGSYVAFPMRKHF